MTQPAATSPTPAGTNSDSPRELASQTWRSHDPDRPERVSVEHYPHGSHDPKPIPSLREQTGGRPSSGRSKSSDPASRRAARLLRHQTSSSQVNYDVPDGYANLDELAATSPVQNPDEAPIHRFRSLEDSRDEERTYQRERQRRSAQLESQEQAPEEEKNPRHGKGATVSAAATQLYTHCYLILFSMLGTLARLGLQTLTEYPGAPVTFGVVWANFGGSLLMGFLSEDRMLFLHEWGTPTYDLKITAAKARDLGEEDTTGADPSGFDLAAAKKAHTATKKTIPLYIGLATGFCGSFTSFSSFIRDIFLAMSNELQIPGGSAPVGRNGGYSFMALLSVVLTTVCLSISALFLGAHLAIVLEPMTPSLPYLVTRKVVDRVAVPVSIGGWLVVVLLSVFPPHSTWRGDALFALVFAPLGCLARFHASIHLNGRKASFPLGTFVANVAGTAVLGMCWDLAHVPIGGVVGCQVLQGVQDGFCGCLTTVSTWVAELASLRRRHAYIYGSVSVVASVAILVAIMGGLVWSSDTLDIMC